MTAERWAQGVRHQLGLGRLLPLGGPGDGAWIVEGVAAAVLRRAAAGVRGVRPGRLRIALTDPDDAQEPAVPPPPGALPPGPLRVTADFAATAAEPLPATASRLRAALTATATAALGLTVTEVDLRVTDLLEEGDEDVTADAPDVLDGIEGFDGPGAGGVPDAGVAEDGVRPSGVSRAPEGADPDDVRAGAAALGVPGVAGLAALGGIGRAVHLEERGGDGAALPRPHARVEIAVAPDHRPSDVAREVRTAVETALPNHPTVAVVVTAVTDPGT
ncbi:hypothetical protein [Streptomyces mangrovisoli]|uniref:Nucleopolyhedrovirus P10 family protein n=1 Tax=Streptomyces mangrovisoli TaxID=1428628 RepID=A0A1J4NV17_9ACTN|nr:hypothetical protein [Streptomyces mangrovisoli]OIJ66144.1 nucleopolyhedrovirus P10 family protein [Streptomyces mangrovisoli]